MKPSLFVSMTLNAWGVQACAYVNIDADTDADTDADKGAQMHAGTSASSDAVGAGRCATRWRRHSTRMGCPVAQTRRPSLSPGRRPVLQQPAHPTAGPRGWAPRVACGRRASDLRCLPLTSWNSAICCWSNLENTLLVTRAARCFFLALRAA